MLTAKNNRREFLLQFRAFRGEKLLIATLRNVYYSAEKDENFSLFFGRAVFGFSFCGVSKINRFLLSAQVSAIVGCLARADIILMFHAQCRACMLRYLIKKKLSLT